MQMLIKLLFKNNEFLFSSPWKIKNVSIITKPWIVASHFWCWVWLGQTLIRFWTDLYWLCGCHPFSVSMEIPAKKNTYWICLFTLFSPCSVTAIYKCVYTCGGVWAVYHTIVLLKSQSGGEWGLLMMRLYEGTVSQ